MKPNSLFSTFTENCKSFWLCIKLLLMTPREFLYSFTYSSSKQVKLLPFDPAAKKAGEQLVKEIQRGCSAVEVHFFGSTSLGIKGLNDIDLFVTTSLKDFRTSAKEMTELFGKPSKIRPFRLEWKFMKSGHKVEIVLLERKSAQFSSQKKIFDALKNDEKLLKEYEELKVAADTRSIRSYHRNRMLFFDKILRKDQKTIFPVLASLFIFVFLIAVYALTVRGIAGNPTAASLNDLMWKDEGPLELSPDRGRFALMYSVLEDKSFTFSLAVAKFAAPDVAFNDGKFVSLFAPTVSYIIMPGYLIGKEFGVSQVGSFAMIALFAFCNFWLIRAIAQKVGASSAAATVGALLFAFGSPAFAYAVTLYQHHISTFILLLSIYILISRKSTWWYVIIWFLCGLSISVDNPNLFLMAPVGIFTLLKVFPVKEKLQQYELTIRWPGVLTMAIMVLPLAFFLYFNKMSYGNAFQLAGTVASGDHVSQLDAGADLPSQLQEKHAPVGEVVVEKNKKSALAFFRPRQLPRGLYEHFLSWDRGMIIFTPVLLIGILGIYFLAKYNPHVAALFVAVIGVNALLYSMWGDPYGGWAFGSRYMIPSYSLFAIFLAYALTRLNRNIFFVLIVFVLGAYSVGVNTIGALTSNRNPPQVEILALEELTGQEEKYTFTRNMQMLDANRSKSFAYSFPWIRDRFTAWQYAQAVIGSIVGLLALASIAVIFAPKKEEGSV